MESSDSKPWIGITALDVKAPFAINELLSNSIDFPFLHQAAGHGVSGICSTTRVLNKIQAWHLQVIEKA